MEEPPHLHLEAQQDVDRQRQPELTIRGTAEARKLEVEERLKQQREALQRIELAKQQEHMQADQDIRASTSTVTLDESPSEQNGGSADAKGKRPMKPFGLAEFGIPPVPEEIEPDPSVMAKLRHFHSLRQQNIRFNATLQSNKSFRNPSILSKLVDFVAVDEKRSAFPEDFWTSSHGLGREAWAASIAEKQKEQSEARQKAQERGKRANIDFAPSGSSASGKDDKKKQSRWGSENDYKDSSAGSSSRKRDRDRDRDRHRDRSRSPSRRR